MNCDTVLVARSRLSLHSGVSPPRVLMTRGLQHLLAQAVPGCRCAWCPENCTHLHDLSRPCEGLSSSSPEADLKCEVIMGDHGRPRPSLSFGFPGFPGFPPAKLRLSCAGSPSHAVSHSTSRQDACLQPGDERKKRILLRLASAARVSCTK